LLFGLNRKKVDREKTQKKGIKFCFIIKFRKRIAERERERDRNWTKIMQRAFVVTKMQTKFRRAKNVDGVFLFSKKILRLEFCEFNNF